ncbi:MAG: HDIG domain-containing protein [Chlamydiales bacterium]|nr:HDIG domain-containing protein [Chlamydiales bacterium]
MDDHLSESGESSLDDDLSELRFSRTQSYFDKSYTIRWIIGILFAVVLFFFLHFRESYVETLDLGQEARRYVVAQVDFSFPDEEATIVLRQEAAYAIGSVYRLSEREIQQQATDFQKYVTQNSAGKESWKKIEEESQFDDVALALSLFTEALNESRFSDERTVNQVNQMPASDLPVPAHYFYAFVPPRVGSKVHLPEGFWESLEKKSLLKSELPTPVLEFLADFLKERKWSFEVDQGVEYTLRKVAQRQVEQKHTKVRAGERLIDQGEKATTRHITMLQAMKERLRDEHNIFSPITISGTILIVFLILTVGVVYLKTSNPEVIGSNQKLALMVTIFTLTILFAKSVEFFLVRDSGQFFNLVRFPLFVPFAAILLSSLLHTRIAAFGTIFLVVIFAMGLAVETVPFIVINVLTATLVIFTNRKVRRRKEIFAVCAKAWLCAFLIAFSFNLYDNTILSFTVIGDLVSTFVFMLFTSVLVVGLIPVLESLFHIMTDITLMEFLDPSNELLRRLTIEAPGTYQHSVVVGNLAEAAATSIGANGLFCRVATQYHDIGKLANPQYFTENQMGGMDMHQLLTPLESAQVIITHVSEGVALARKVGLPEKFIDVIKEHHGTTLVYYFYHKQLEMMGGDKGRVDQSDFRYSGPKPRTKESTIIMIADTLEAASRCLDSYTEETVSELIDGLIAQKVEDGQFDDSLLTFEELGIVKSVLLKTLLAASHPRVKYPKHNPGEEG